MNKELLSALAKELGRPGNLPPVVFLGKWTILYDSTSDTSRILDSVTGEPISELERAALEARLRQELVSIPSFVSAMTETAKKGGVI